MKNELPLVQSPIIGYQHHVYPLSILLNYNECLPWFYSNYIQLEANLTAGSAFNFVYSWYNRNPWFCHEMLFLDTLTNNNINVLEFITNCIDLGKYVETSINHFYIPDSNFYKQKALIHDILIYGYDRSKKVIYTYGYLNNELKKSELTYDDFLQAFMNSGQNLHINLLKKTNDFSYAFDIQWVIDQIEDYVFSRNTYERFRMYRNPPCNSIFGLDTYKYLIDYLEALNLKKTDIYDIRHLQILYEHKKCMVKRIQYMIEVNIRGNLDKYYKEYEKIRRSTYRIRTSFLKLKFSRNTNILEKAILELTQVSKIEKMILEELLFDLKKN